MYGRSLFVRMRMRRRLGFKNGGFFFQIFYIELGGEGKKERREKSEVFFFRCVWMGFFFPRGLGVFFLFLMERLGKFGIYHLSFFLSILSIYQLAS